MHRITLFLPLISIFLVIACTNTPRSTEWYKQNHEELAVQLASCSELNQTRLQQNCANATAAYEELSSKVRVAIDNASMARIIVFENILNGNAFTYGWPIEISDSPNPTPFKNISISSQTGVVTIALTEELEGTFIYLTPMTFSRTALVTGVIPQERVEWHCFTTNANHSTLFLLPKDCENILEP